MPGALLGGLGSRACMLLSTSLFSLSGFFCVEAMAQCGAWLVLLSRFALALAVMSLAAFTSVGPRGARTLMRPRPAYLMRAACLVGAQGAFLRCAATSGLFVAIVLYNTGPMFLVVIEAAWQRHRVAAGSLAWCAVGFAGVWLVHGPDARAGPRALMFGLGSGVLYALSQFTLYLASTEDREPTVVWQTFFWCSAICLAPAALATPPGRLAQLLVHPRAASWLLMGALCGLGNQWFRTVAYRGATRVGALAPLLYFGIVVALALQTLQSRSPPSSGQFLGTACIVLAALGARAVRSPPA